MTKVDFAILYATQNMRTPFLDKVFVTITSIPGNYGQMWVVIGIMLLFFKKTRKCGVVLILSYLMVFGLGQYVLKDLIARPRPCHIDQTMELLISKPSSYSCPSTHSGWAFAAAMSIFFYNKKIGTPVIVFSFLVAFSRLYLFVHFPSDVLFGIVIGIGFALLTKYIINKIYDAHKNFI